MKLRPILKGPPNWRSRHIEQVPITALRPYPANARAHSKQQITQLALAIQEFGMIGPIVIDGENTILSGHARVDAVKQLGWDAVPAIRVEHLSEAQKRAYILADNRLAELASWDKAKLARELQYLVDLNYEVEITGFETPQIDLIFEEAASADAEDPADWTPPVDRAKPPVSRFGDAWWLGRHRLLCADARERGSYQGLLGSECAQMVFTDAPYNVPIKGHVSGRQRHGEFVMASGEMPTAVFEKDFLTPVLKHLAAFSRDGSIHFHCMDWRHAGEMLAAGKAAYSELKNLCVWCKTNGGMGSLYRSQHELVFVWKSGKAPHINNIELGRHGRNRTNLWQYPGVNSFGAERDAELSMHPTVKPVALVADAILDCSKRNGLILDPFVGSGTTIIAAERTGRKAAAIELDPRYVDTAIRRWLALIGSAAVHASTGLTFAEHEGRARTLLPSPCSTASSEGR
jgi:DNA methylase/ParB-like nuclease domain